MDISKDIMDNKTLLLVLEEKEYEDNREDVLKSLVKIDKKICYVCLNKPYKDVIEDLKDHGVRINNFFFIDVLSSHYNKQKSSKNCIFVSAPNDLASIIKALTEAVKKKGCKIVIFDTISTFLIYKQNYIILKFTHKIIEESLKGERKILITLKGGDIIKGERDELIKDLIMFADVSITIETKEEMEKAFKKKVLLNIKG